MTTTTTAAELVERARANARAAVATSPTRDSFRAVRSGEGAWVICEEAERVERAVAYGYPVTLYLPDGPTQTVKVVRAGRRFQHLGETQCYGYWSPIPEATSAA